MNKELYIKRSASAKEELSMIEGLKFPISCLSMPYIVFYEKPTVKNKASTYYSEPSLTRAENFISDIKSGNYKETKPEYDSSFYDAISLFNSFKANNASLIEEFIASSFEKCIPLEYKNARFENVESIRVFSSEMARFIEYCSIPIKNFQITVDSSDFYTTKRSYKISESGMFSFDKQACLKTLKLSRDKKTPVKELYESCLSALLFLLCAVNKHVENNILITRNYIADACDNSSNCLNIKESCSLLIEELEGDIGSLSGNTACNAHNLAEYISENYPKKQSWQKCSELFSLLPELKINGFAMSKNSILAYICAK